MVVVGYWSQVKADQRTVHNEGGGCRAGKKLEKGKTLNLSVENEQYTKTMKDWISCYEKNGGLCNQRRRSAKKEPEAQGA